MCGVFWFEYIVYVREKIETPVIVITSPRPDTCDRTTSSRARHRASHSSTDADVLPDVRELTRD